MTFSTSQTNIFELLERYNLDNSDNDISLERPKMIWERASSKIVPECLRNSMFYLDDVDCEDSDERILFTQRRTGDLEKFSCDCLSIKSFIRKVSTPKVLTRKKKKTRKNIKSQRAVASRSITRSRARLLRRTRSGKICIA